MNRAAGFSLVEALLACALLGLVLVPALGAFRAHLAAADRMRARLRVERTLTARLNQSELRILADEPGTRPSGYDADGLRVVEHPLEPVACGTNLLWQIAIEVSDPGKQLSRAGTRWLVHTPSARKAQP